MSDDRTIAEDDRVDDNDKTAAGYIRRLGRIENILDKANNRLRTLIAHVGAVPPPDDQDPGILTAVGGVKTAAQETLTLAGQLEDEIRTV
jgi:hypothetical protein